MTEKTRLEEFKELVEMEPNDTFCRYALGMEYMGVSEFEEAIINFTKAVELDPAYSAAYFQAAIASKNLQKIDQAREFLQKGIEVAEKKGDWHARDEMKQALEDLDLMQ